MQISGTLYWAKLDKPRDNYNKQHKIMKDGQPDCWGREYSVVFANLSKADKLALRDAGLLDRVKNKMDDLEDQITFRLDETKRDGDLNDPIVVTNGETMREWDWKEDGLIGNRSKGVMKFNVWRGGQGKPRIFPVALLVTEHVPYEAPDNTYEDPNDWSEYAPAKEKAPAKAKGKEKVVAEGELDDEIPF